MSSETSFFDIIRQDSSYIKELEENGSRKIKLDYFIENSSETKIPTIEYIDKNDLGVNDLLQSEDEVRKIFQLIKELDFLGCQNLLKPLIMIAFAYKETYPEEYASLPDYMHNEIDFFREKLLDFSDNNQFVKDFIPNFLEMCYVNRNNFVTYYSEQEPLLYKFLIIKKHLRYNSVDCNIEFCFEEVHQEENIVWLFIEDNYIHKHIFNKLYPLEYVYITDENQVGEKYVILFKYQYLFNIISVVLDIINNYDYDLDKNISMVADTKNKFIHKEFFEVTHLPEQK